MTCTLEQTVEQARAGDKSALEQVIVQIQGKVYTMAVRMLWHPEDARDATQEILIRVITHLGSFRGESAFMTWVYRVTANYLSTVRRSRMEEQAYTFERFGSDLDEGLSDLPIQTENQADKALLLEEVKIGCTLGMLLCLDRPHRLAYILGEILELDSPEAAAILEIAPATFRKRLSRARTDIVDFMKWKCGLMTRENPCRCRRRVNRALELRRIDPEHLLFAHNGEVARKFPEVLKEVQKLNETRRAVALYRLHPQYPMAEDFSVIVRNLIDP
jgi:RNA polymerase sigma factor (sigma-70 family)